MNYEMQKKPREPIETDGYYNRDIKFERTGGCFVSKTKGLILAVVVVLLLFLTFWFTREYYCCSENGPPSQSESSLSNEKLSPPSPSEKFVYPKLYDLKLKVFLDTAPKGYTPFSFNGEVEINLEVMKDVSVITLDCSDLKIMSPNVTLRKIITPAENENKTGEMSSLWMMADTESSEGKIPLKGVIYDGLSQQCSIEVAQSLSVGMYVLRIPFSGSIGDKPFGLFRRSYKTNGKNSWIAATQLYPANARKLFPCFDDPSMKAVFILSIFRRRNATALSNMPSKLGDAGGANGWVWETFEPSTVMSPHSLGLVVMSEIAVAQIGDKPRVSIWTRPKYINCTLYTASFIPNLLSVFQDNIIGSPYPLPKLDVVALPDFSAGVTGGNWGILLVSENELIGSEQTQKRLVISSSLTIGRQLVHQWIGNLVSMSDWNQLWLWESLTDYLSYAANHKLRKDWGYWDLFELEKRLEGLSVDSFESENPLHTPLTKQADIYRSFRPLVRTKGPAILKMIFSLLPPKGYKNVLKDFVHKWKYKSADVSDFWNEVERTAIRSETSFIIQANETQLSDVIDTWINTNGYPYINIHTQPFSNTTSIVQQSILSAHSENKKHSELWYIPISIASPDSNQSQIIWFKKEKETLTPSEYSIVEAAMNSFCRVNYDQSTWLSMNGSQQLDPTLISRMIDDVFTLASFHEIPYKIPLYLTTQLGPIMPLYLTTMLVPNTSLLPWITLLKKLKYLQRFFVDSPKYDLFKEYVNRVLSPVHELVLDRLEGGSDDLCAEMFCEEIFSQLSDFGYFNHWTHPELDAHVSTDNNNATNSTLLSQMQNIIYCSSVYKGNETTWSTLWDKLANFNTTCSKDRIDVIKGLSCTPDAAKIELLLGETIKPDNPVIFTQELPILWETLSENIYACPTVFQYYRSNLQSIIDRKVGDVDVMYSIIQNSIKCVLTHSQWDQLEPLRALHESIPYFKSQDFDKLLEVAQQNCDWRFKFQPDIEDWLHEHYYIG